MQLQCSIIKSLLCDLTRSYFPAPMFLNMFTPSCFRLKCMFVMIPTPSSFSRLISHSFLKNLSAPIFWNITPPSPFHVWCRYLCSHWVAFLSAPMCLILSTPSLIQTRTSQPICMSGNISRIQIPDDQMSALAFRLKYPSIISESAMWHYLHSLFDPNLLDSTPFRIQTQNDGFRFCRAPNHTKESNTTHIYQTDHEQWHSTTHLKLLDSNSTWPTNLFTTPLSTNVSP